MSGGKPIAGVLELRPVTLFASTKARALAAYNARIFRTGQPPVESTVSCN